MIVNFTTGDLKRLVQAYVRQKYGVDVGLADITGVYTAPGNPDRDTLGLISIEVKLSTIRVEPSDVSPVELERKITPEL